MTKKLLILGVFCSLSFGGISDDIAKEKNSAKSIETIKAYIDSKYKECRYIQLYEQEYSLAELEKLYEDAENINDTILALNQEFKLEIDKFLSSYTDDPKREAIARDILGEAYYRMKDDEIVCFKMYNTEKYVEDIKETYTKVKEKEEKASAESEIKKIIENELYDQNRFRGTNEYTVEDYDDFLAKAKDVWVRIRQLNQGDELSIPTYSYWFNTEQRYIDELQKQKQDKIERMARDNKSSQSKKTLIPKYKKWKTTTVPKFQKSLKAGDYVIGGIVWKVDGNLVVIDAGRDGLKSQQRNQTLPRVPQDLMPLFMDEITGVTKY